MDFEEVTGRLAVPVNYPGHADDGLPLNIAIPTMAIVRIWQAVHGGYTWVIMHEPGLPHWSADQKRTHVGYSASYRRMDQRTNRETIKIDGGPWDAFTKAEDACKRVWRQIRSPH